MLKIMPFTWTAFHELSKVIVWTRHRRDRSVWTTDCSCSPIPAYAITIGRDPHRIQSPIRGFGDTLISLKLSICYPIHYLFLMAIGGHPFMISTLTRERVRLRRTHTDWDGSEFLCGRPCGRIWKKCRAHWCYVVCFSSKAAGVFVPEFRL